MSLLVAIPIHGYGETAFWKSLLRLQEDLIGAVNHDFLIIENESLIQRARNNAVTTFLETDYERLLFIDSDIEFKVEDVEKLWNLNADVAVAAYPMKRKDEPASAWVDGDLVNLDELSSVVEVDFAGTGFMMIKRHVFNMFQTYYPARWHFEGKPGENVYEKRRSFGYFTCPIEDSIQYSEDYRFCQDWRNLGGKILLDPSIRLVHWGKYGYGTR